MAVPALLALCTGLSRSVAAARWTQLDDWEPRRLFASTATEDSLYIFAGRPFLAPLSALHPCHHDRDAAAGLLFRLYPMSTLHCPCV